MCNNLISAWTPSTHALVCFSIGYFIYDALDMVIYHRYDLIYLNRLCKIWFIIFWIKKKTHIGVIGNFKSICAFFVKPEVQRNNLKKIRYLYNFLSGLVQLFFRYLSVSYTFQNCTLYNIIHFCLTSVIKLKLVYSTCYGCTL